MPVDLFELLLNEYREWLVDGKVNFNKVRVDLKIVEINFVPLEPASKFNLEGAFIAFCRAYLHVNPIVGVATGTPGCGITLRDRTSVSLAKVNQAPSQTAGSWPITGLSVGPNNQLPNTFSAPITKDKPG